MTLTERKKVHLIKAFFDENYLPHGKIPEANVLDSQASIDEKINVFLDTNEIQGEDREVLFAALTMQYNAWNYCQKHYAESKSSRGGDSLGSLHFDTPIIFFPYGGGWGHCHHSGGWDCGGDGGEIILVFLGIILAALALAAAYSLAQNLWEISRELYNSQRVGSNIATLTLTAGFVTGAIVGMAVLLGSNPIGWAIGGALLIAATALLVFGVRELANSIDASKAAGSGLSTDSRFQLTAAEESFLREDCQATEEDITKIKGIITGLAVQASSLNNRTGFFGSTDQYSKIIRALTAVKKGELSAGLQNQYDLKEFSERKQQGHSSGSPAVS